MTTPEQRQPVDRGRANGKLYISSEPMMPADQWELDGPVPSAYVLERVNPNGTVSRFEVDEEEARHVLSRLEELLPEPSLF